MELAEGIRKSPYEEGLYFVKPESGTTLQDHSTQWQVGARYSLIKILGYGSYSAVVLALDHTTGEKVRGSWGGRQVVLQTKAEAWMGVRCAGSRTVAALPARGGGKLVQRTAQRKGGWPAWLVGTQPCSNL